jgi:hypothetical protein
LSPKLTVVIIVGLPSVLFAMSGFRAYQLAQEGEVPEAFRDLNCDGKVSPAEWLRGGIDFRLRPSKLVEGCQDVYMVKSSEAVVVRCETAPRCRLVHDLKR